MKDDTTSQEGRVYLSTTFAPDNSPVSGVLELCKQYGIHNFELGSNHNYEKKFDRIVKQYDFNYLVHNYFPAPKVVLYKTKSSTYVLLFLL